MKLLCFTLVAIVFAAQTPFAQSKILPGCTQAQYYVGILKLYALEKPKEAASIAKELVFIGIQACDGTFAESDTIRYRNGQLATNYAGRSDAAWYWPNGQLLTSYALGLDASVYYPDGHLMTNSFLRTNSTYYYPNSKVISDYIGQRGTINLLDDHRISSPGFSDESQHLDFLQMTDFVSQINLS